MKVCFLGLGSMGSGVCRNLLNKGYALQVWNRSPEKAAKVAGWGAEAFATPQEAACGAGVVMSCLSSVAALKAVAGGEDGVFSCMVTLTSLKATLKAASTLNQLSLKVTTKCVSSKKKSSDQYYHLLRSKTSTKLWKLLTIQSTA